ncbi:MAG TPA: NAD-dependent epimerase/dehydratase family protein [Gaiellaceae bacterium]|nr:NAD-dependent epimerase/dehydratase family protein [Gaiellaceae bacterium]
MKVVVVGATGNVGTALLRALAEEDAIESVVGVARRRPQTAFAKTTWATADVAHDDLAPHFAGAACVVHLAWQIQPSHDRSRTWLTNVHGSRRVFEAAAAAGVPALVYASSVGAYSPGPKDSLVDESWPTGGIQTSFYSRDKAEVERLLDRFEAEHPDVRVARLRPSLIFQRAMGTEVKRLFTGRWVPHRLVAPERIPFVPDLPRLRFQVTHADDVADAYRRLVAGDARGAFNLAAEPVLDPDVLAQLLGARKVRVPARWARGVVAATWRARLQPTPEGWLDMALQTPLLDAARAREKLGWTPRWSAGDALLDLLRGFHEGAGAPTPPLVA